MISRKLISVADIEIQRNNTVSYGIHRLRSNILPPISGFTRHDRCYNTERHNMCEKDMLTLLGECCLLEY
jgi:hypothetical protein